MAISGIDLLEVPTMYVWPIFQADVSGNLPIKDCLKNGDRYLYFRILEFPLILAEIQRNLDIASYVWLM